MGDGRQGEREFGGCVALSLNSAFEERLQVGLNSALAKCKRVVSNEGSGTEKGS
jgi:hypothetical protein